MVSVSYLKQVYYRLANALTFRLQHVLFSDFVIYGLLSVKNKGSLIIGKNFSANSGKNHNPIGGDTILRLITQFESSKLTIGSNVGISNATIVCYNKITIGDGVVIGGGVRIWDTNFHSLDPLIRLSGNDYDIKTGEIMIETGAFIGAGSIILKGVKIGKNTVIGAGSVVSRDVPENVIAAGNPCVPLKQLQSGK